MNWVSTRLPTCWTSSMVTVPVRKPAEAGASEGSGDPASAQAALPRHQRRAGLARTRQGAVLPQPNNHTPGSIRSVAQADAADTSPRRPRRSRSLPPCRTRHIAGIPRLLAGRVNAASRSPARSWPPGEQGHRFRVSAPPPAISHHQNVLHDAGLLGCDKRDVWIYDRAWPSALASLGTLIGDRLIRFRAGASR
jgi:hypothetical protein